MSLNGAFMISSSAMNAHGQALGAISDNISNLNTGGYRRRETNFSEMLGSTDKYQAKSSSTKFGVTTRVEADGSYAASGGGLDAAMNGRALFAVSKGSGGTDQYYTRFGAFAVAADQGGILRLAAQGDYYLMGWPVDDAGVVTPSLQTIALPSKTQPLPAQATTTATINDNLPAIAAVGDQVDRTISVYDASGAIHDIALTFVNAGVNSWTVTAASASGPVTLDTVPMTLNFNSTDGNLAGSGAVNLTGTWPGGQSSTIALSFAGMTQWGLDSAPRGSVIDGAPAGIVGSYFFDREGILNVSYSNGRVRPIYQIPGAVFRNADGLTEYSGDVFKANGDSGAAMMFDPRTSELGNFLPNTLELSNVDLAEEMTGLIQTQRAYSTAATAFRTVDEMMTTVRDLKR